MQVDLESEKSRKSWWSSSRDTRKAESCEVRVLWSGYIFAVGFARRMFGMGGVPLPG
jgi:hypothetical protein